MPTASWLIPLAIYFGKIIELSLNSIRIVSIAKGFKRLALVISFLEAIIWVIIIVNIIGDIDNWLNILAFAFGQATGTYMGIWIEQKLALGLVMIRLVTQKATSELLVQLRSAGFRVVDVDATSNYGNVKILFATIRRKSLNEFTRLVHRFNPYAFFTVEEVKFASQVIMKPSRVAIKSILKQFNLPGNADNIETAPADTAQRQTDHKQPLALPQKNNTTATKLKPKLKRSASAKSVRKQRTTAVAAATAAKSRRQKH